jgi:hypothetical protein
VSCSAICDAMMRRRAHRAHAIDLVSPAPERWVLRAAGSCPASPTWAWPGWSPTPGCATSLEERDAETVARMRDEDLRRAGGR